MMASWTVFLVSPFIVLAADYEGAFKVTYETVLQKKCESLKLWYDAAFIGDRCFAISKKAIAANLTTWYKSLKQECNHLYGYHAKVGNIFSEKQINELLLHDVVQNNKKYFVGARQTSTDKDISYGCCENREQHLKQWLYMSDDTTKIGGQPDNAGSGKGEYVVALSKTADSNKLGFNDVNPEEEKYQVLCEYEDFMKCQDGWTLIESFCYKINTTPKTVIDAREHCRKDGEQGKLAAIHNDGINQILADNFKMTSYDASDRDLSHNPVLFGLTYDAGWTYHNGDQVDFFRWYDNSGDFRPANGSSVLLNTLNSGYHGEARYTYWTVGKANNAYPFICQAQPTIS